MNDRAPRGFAAALFALMVLIASPSGAQTGITFGHLEDASVAPPGLLRLRVTGVWSRYDSRFTSTGVEPLGAAFTSPTLGPAQVPALAMTQSLIATASASPFSLSLGQSRLGATGREEVIPIGFEYGLTPRVMVGVTVPIVRTRVATVFNLDSTGATVGPNLHRTSDAARQVNSATQSEFAAAALQLQTRLADCAANSAGAGCAELLARQSEAEQLLASSQDFAATLDALYGSAASEGQAFVPRAGGDAQAGVAFRVADFNARYREILASGSDLITTVPVGAGGPPGSSQFQNYLHAELGRDSLIGEERVGFGDIGVTVKALMIDRPVSETRRLGVQSAVVAGLRLPTGSRQSPTELTDMALGAGALMADVRGLADVRFGRLGLMAGASILVAMDGEAASPQARDRSAIAVHLAPRWHLSEPLSLHGAFSHHDGDVSGATQYVGGGVTLSTLSGFRRAGGRGIPLPIEVRYTHLEAISGQAGTPKYFRDQIELRLYFRVRR